MDYKSTIKSRPYFYKESKKVVSLINSGIELTDIKIKSIEENIFQVERESRRREIASVIINRFKVLDEYLFKKIETSSIETSKIIVLYSIWKTDRLFNEFINEVIKEKITIKDMYLRDKDLNMFFQYKREQSEKVNSWGEYTFKKLKQVYIKILFESGILANKNEESEIRIPIIENEVRKSIISNGGKLFIEALQGSINL